MVEAHFRGRLSRSIRFAVQERVEGTAAAVRLGRDFAAREPFLLTFGDILCGPSQLHRHRRFADPQRRIRSSRRQRSTRMIPWQGAAVYADAAGAVSEMIEKPPRGSSTTHWNSAGLYAFTPEIFGEIDTAPRSERGEYEITTAIRQLIARGRPVRMFEMEGAWRDVGRPEDLAEAGRVLSESGGGEL